MDKKNSDNLQQDGLGGNDVSQSEKRNGSIAEATPSTLEKDIGTSKVKTQSVKAGKAQSGPLVPGTVLGHYLPERGRLFDRYIFILYLFLFLCWVLFGSSGENVMERKGKGWDEMEGKDGRENNSLPHV